MRETKIKRGINSILVKCLTVLFAVGLARGVRADFFWTAGASADTDWNTAANWSGTLDSTANYVFGGFEGSKWVKGNDITVSFAGSYSATPSVGVWVENVDSSNNGSLTWAADTDEHGLALTGNLTVGTGTPANMILSKGSYTVGGCGYVSAGTGAAYPTSFKVDGASLTINGSKNETIDNIDYKSGFYVLQGNNTHGTEVCVTNGVLAVANGDAVLSANGCWTSDYDNQTVTGYVTLDIDNGGVFSCGDTTTPYSLMMGRWGNEDVTVNLNKGGVLKVGGITWKWSWGTKQLNFNGGTLQALGNSNDFIANLDSPINVVVGSAGGTIDTNGKAITIAASVTGTGTLLVTGGGSVTFTKTPACQVLVDNDGTTATIEPTVLDLDFEDSGKYADGWVGKTIQSACIGSGVNTGAGASLTQNTRANGSKYLNIGVTKVNGYRGAVYAMQPIDISKCAYTLEFDWYAVSGYQDSNWNGNSSGFALFDSAGTEIMGVDVPGGKNVTATVFKGAKEEALGTLSTERGGLPTTNTELWHHVTVYRDVNDTSLKLTIKDGNGKVKIDSASLGNFSNIATLYFCIGEKGNNYSVNGGVDNIVAVTKDIVPTRLAEVVTSSGTASYSDVAAAIDAAVALGAANYDYVAIYGDYEIPMTAAKSGVKVKAMGTAAVTAANAGLNDVEYGVSSATDETSGVTTYTFGNKACAYTWAGENGANWSAASNWTYGDDVEATRAPTSGDSVVLGSNTSVTLDKAVASQDAQLASIAAADETAVIINSEKYSHADGMTAALQNSAWKGTYRIAFNIITKSECSEFEYFNYGNANSVIEFNGNLEIYRLKKGTFNGKVKIAGSLTVTASYSGGAESKIAELSGDGSWTYKASSYWQRYIINDASDFTGSLDAWNDNAFSIANSSIYNTGTIWIANDTAVLGAGAVWKASKGIKIGANNVKVKGGCNLTVTGTDAGNNIFILSGATFAYDSLGTVAFSAQPKFCTALTTGSSTEATSSGKATVNIAFGTGVTLSDGVRLMSWPEGTAPDNVDFVFADSTLDSNWVLVPGATGLTISKPVVVVDNTASLDVASALTAATGTSKIRVMGDTSAAITLTDRQTLVVDSGVDYTGALTVNGGVAVLPAGAAPSAITIGASGVLAFDLTGQTIVNGGVYTLTATEPTFSAAVDGPETCIFTIGPDFASTIEYSDGALKATATGAASGKTRQITMLLNDNAYIDGASDFSNGTPNALVWASTIYDTSRRDVVVFPATMTMKAYHPNYCNDFIAVVRGSATTLTLVSDMGGGVASTITLDRLVSTGTVHCDNFGIVVANASASMGSLAASNAGSFTIPSGVEVGTLALNDASTLKIAVAAEPATTDALLVTAGDTSAAAISSDQYMISGEYSAATGKTAWKAYARNAYVSAWEDSFNDAASVTANFSRGTVANTIFNTTAGTESGNVSSYVSQAVRTVDGEEVKYANVIVSSGTVNILYSLSRDYAGYSDQRLQFDWFAGSGYYSNAASENGLAIVAANGTVLATMNSPNSSGNGKTATATIYRGDDENTVLGTLTSAARDYDTDNAAFWYRVTVSTTASGVRLNIVNIATGNPVALSDNVLSTTPLAIGTLAIHEVRRNVSNKTALANVSITVPDYLDMPSKPVIAANGSGRDVQTITITGGTGESLYFWTSLDSTIREYTGPFELPNTGTVYAYAQNQSGIKSLNSSEYFYSNLGAIKLVAPTVCRRGFERLYITANETGVTGQPVPVFKYIVDDGETVALGSGATQLPQISGLESKTVKVWATHELYGDSDVVTWSAPVSVSAEDYAIAFDLDYVQTFIDNPGTPAMNTSIGKQHDVAEAEGEKNVFGSDEGYFYAVTCNSASLYDPVWYSINTASSTLRWKRGEYGLSQDNNASKGVWPEIMLADMKAGAKIYINANDAPQIQGNATLASSGNGEYVYTVSADGDCRFGIRRYVGGGSSGTAVNVHALRIYEPAVAKAGGVGYLTIDEAVAAAASTGGSVSVVDSSVVSGAAVALKPGVTLAGLENIAPSSVSVSTTINEETVDITSYYKAESLAVVNGAIAPELADSVKVELSENAVAEGVDDVIAVTTTAPTFKLKNSVKKGLYYGVGTYDPESGIVTPQVEQRATSDNQGIILSPSFTFGDGTHVLYYKLTVSDTPTVNN